MFWRMIDISILNSWIIFRSNFPESEISSHRLFRIHLVHELVQPLLMLKASPDCPVHLSSGKGRRPASSEKRLLGKHFAYKSPQRGRCVVCSNTKTRDGKAQGHENYELLYKMRGSPLCGDLFRNISHEIQVLKVNCMVS